MPAEMSVLPLPTSASVSWKPFGSLKAAWKSSPLLGSTIGSALEAIAAKQPTPGGGAVASLTAALAAATARMVLHYSLGKPLLAEHARWALDRIG